MANTWTTVESKSNPKGLATLTIGDKKVKIEFVDGSVNKDFYKEDLPDEPAFIHKLPKGTKMEVFVVLSNDKQSVDRFGPDKGRANFRVVDFVRPEKDSDPAPKEYQGNDKYKKEGQDNTYKAFTVLLEIVEGRWKGCQVPFFLHYKFGDDGKGNTAFFGDPSKSKNTKKLQDFCEAAGATDKRIPWPEDGNVLPPLLKAILRADKTFEAQIKDGYIETILTGRLDDDDLDADEMFPAKKSKPAGKAKRKPKDE